MELLAHSQRSDSALENNKKERQKEKLPELPELYTGELGELKRTKNHEVIQQKKTARTIGRVQASSQTTSKRVKEAFGKRTIRHNKRKCILCLQSIVGKLLHTQRKSIQYYG